ncbi:MAG TPA: hypothetical protein VGO92_12820, partial [Acidimicrobiales bacterium]|nr:hypothetical protein [Acidimicrobiales bacterium]
MHDAPGSAPETQAPRRSRRPHRHVAACIVLAVATLAGGLAASSARLAPAAADTPYTFVDERFDEAAFPPTGWEVTSGAWAADCDPAPPDGGCFAQASVTTDEVGLKSQLLFRPAQGIPADLIDPTLSFTSTFTPDATSAGDRISVSQPLLPSGDLGDRHLIVDLFGGQSADDATGVPVAHSVPLTSLNLPLVFRWDSLGDSGGSPLSTWGIANVRITGTLPATPYVLTANPVVNTTYHPVAGTPVTITLSGSSDPVGDTLGFVIVTPPALGQVGPVTPTDATHATVVYSTPTAGCPDPEGTPGFLCTDHFTFKVTDAQGHESAPANVALDVSPGGAGSQQVAITAPGSSGYVTVSHGGQPAQAADLSGLVTVGPGAFPDQIELKVHASAGSVDLVNAGASGATFINGTSSPGLQIDMKGSAAKLNHALALFLWFPPAGTTPTATIDIFARDLGPTGSGPFGAVQQATVTINGVANNPRPVLSVPTGPLSIANTGGP